MRKIRFILLALLSVLYSSCGKHSDKSSLILGKWYGLKDGGRITVEFRNDQTMSIHSEAFSALTFTGQYQIDYDVEPITVDLILPDGIVCAAIMSISNDGTMEFYGFFGAPGYTQRPESVDTNPKRPDALYLKLSRDIKIIKQKPKAATPPEEAKLAFERNKRLGRGLNLNGLLDNNSGDFHMYPIPDQPIKPDYIKMIAEAGFNSVRLPIAWSVHSSNTSPYTIEPAFFKKVDNIVNLCLKNDLAVVIDMHYYPYINMHYADPVLSFDDNIKRFYLLWEQIAEHYKDYPPEVYFEILNEPNMELGAQRYNELIAESIQSIRKTNPGRTILIGTPNLGQSWTIGLLDLPSYSTKIPFVLSGLKPTGWIPCYQTRRVYALSPC
jgi:endoglucanase